MSDNRKDFYNIAELSEEFSRFVAKTQPGNTVPLNTHLLYWQARFQLAIAQQLAMVAKHLGKIVGKAEELNGEDRNGSTHRR